MRRNQKGSVLLWAITIIMVLMITIAAALGISYSYYNRSVDDSSKRQAYLTAKGVIQNIVEKIELNNSGYIAVIPKEESQSTPLNTDTPEASNIGKVTEARISCVTVDKDRDIRGKTTISATVDYVEQTETVNADTQLGRTGDLKKWQLLKYYKGQGAEVQENINIKNTKIMASHLTSLYEITCTGNKVMQEYVKSDAETYGRMIVEYGETWEKYANNGYYSNDRMREYLYIGVYNSSIPKFGNSAAPNFPEKFEDKTFYMKTYCSNGKKLLFVYASEKSTVSNGDWEASVIFDVENGYWHDVTELNGNKIMPLKILGEPVDGKESENELLKWGTFKKKYFILERRVD